MSPDRHQAADEAPRRFQTTIWDDLRRARTLNAARRRDALGTVIGRYWRPVFWYLQYKGYDQERARDLTQGFFADIVLGRDLVAHADEEKGRFRTFLLVALDRYRTSEYRKATAAKRAPAEGLLRLDDDELSDVPCFDEALSPEQAYDYAWACTLLDDALAAVERACRDDGMETHWVVFREKVLKPIMEGVEPPPLKEVCEAYGIPDEAQASNMGITVKRRFQAALRDRVKKMVASDAEVDDEIQALMTILAECGAGA